MNLKLSLITVVSSLLWLTMAMGVAQANSDQALYLVLEEPFTINFLRQSQQRARYLQVRVALRADDPQIIETARQNQPLIQDSLRVLLSEQTMDSINSVEGRRALQQQALERVRTIILNESGRDNLEQLYFTSFIWQ